MCKAILILCCAMFSACATVEITELTNMTPYKDGLRFYRPEVFMLVTKDTNNNILQMQPVSFPDKSQEYVLRSTVGIGAVEMSATLEGGWNLTAMGATIDSKVPETITALTGALQAAAERSAMPVTVETDGVGRYAQELEAAIYFCCLEALQNAAKHAGDGAKVSVRLSQDDGQVQFEVGDDGRGYDAAAMGPSAGLQNMADRIGAHGGDLQTESTLGAGTTVRGSVPIDVTR